ncbi:contact-dependent growth inhibition system immunity protein [Marinoscillum pacificum]|uniref:contact-dependent growth inhibition system immunity protein n=1 Tax=Marinoscillum pacificum TaxID=392723 RepID=UPI0021581BDB|nr:contact-dependent growth inhibition system immunity protein [Marinoscillum pacificum]
MKLENNWRYKNLASLEKKNLGPTPSYGSYLATTVHELYKKQLSEFTIEDLRIMIGQNIGLPFLIPLAIEQLAIDLLAEGDMYEGDLLVNVLKSDVAYWKSEKPNWKKVVDLYFKNKVMLDEVDTTNSIRNGWIEAFHEFKKFHEKK